MLTRRLAAQQASPIEAHCIAISSFLLAAGTNGWRWAAPRAIEELPMHEHAVLLWRTNVERCQVGRNHHSQRTTSTSNTQALTTATTSEKATPGTSQ